MGGNLGEVPRTFDRVIESLGKADAIRGLRESRRFSTKPVGGNGGNSAAYLNSAVEMKISCSLPELLRILQRIEGKLGRRREAYWGSRTIDLDLLLHEREEIRTAELTVPHPHLWYRRFALDPLAELAGEVVHPERGITIAALRERLLDRPMRCGIYGGESERREEIVRVLCGEFPGVEMRAWGRGASGPASEALSLWLGPRTDLEKDTGEFEELPRVSRFDVRTIPLFATDAIRQMLVAACGE